MPDAPVPTDFITQATDMIEQNLSVFYFIGCMLLFTSVAGAQETSIKSDSICPQRDVSDVFRGWLDKEPKADSSSAGSVLLIPIIGSNPATGFMIGVGLQYGFKIPGGATRYSMISGSLQYTTKDQKIF